MQTKKHNASTMLIWLCWLVYTCSYIGKVNYSANINQIMEFYKVDHSSAGLVSTLFFFAYGIGQVVNGLLCKKYNLKWIIFASLTISGIVNLLVGITNNFALINALWLINGFSMSVLWPCLIRLLAETLSKKDMAKASITMGTTVAVGTFLVYALSALFVKLNFKLSFYLPSVIFIAVAIVWVLSYNSLTNKASEENTDEIPTPTLSVTTQTEKTDKKALMLTICALAIFGIATNLIKDGLTTWVPSILKEQYSLDSSISIILTLALPIVAIFGNAFAIRVHKKIPDFALQCAIIYLTSGIIIGGVIAGTALNQFVITIVGFAVVCFLASSCNSLITSIFPLFMKGKVNSGRIAGILNGFCYVGSTLSSFGLGEIADNHGWEMVFWVLIAVCVLVCVVYGIYFIIKKSFIKNTPLKSEENA